MKKWVSCNWTIDKVDEIKNEAVYCNSMGEFAEALGVSWITAKKYARELGIDIPDGRWRSGSLPKPKRNYAIYAKWKQGKSYSELSREYELSRQRIYAIVQAEQKKVAPEA